MRPRSSGAFVDVRVVGLGIHPFNAAHMIIYCIKLKLIVVDG